MAAELRVDTIKGRSGINTFTFKGDGFSFDQKVGIGTTVASDPVLSTNAGKLSVGVVSTYSLYSDGAIFSANVSIGGSLTVDGTQTIINTEELNIQDKTIGIGSTSSPTSSTQDGAGIHIFGQTRVDMLYDNNKSALGFSTSIDVTGFATFSSGIKAQDVSIAGAAATLRSNGNASFSGIVTATSFSGTLDTAAQTNITSVGTLGSLTVSGDVSIADKIVHTGDTNTAIRFPAADTITFETSGSEALRVNSDGYVGINTTQRSIAGMTEYLSVSARSTSGGGSAIEIVGNRTGADQTLGVINFVNDASNVAQITAKYQGSTTDGSLQLLTSGSERLRITSNGELLVGTASGDATYQAHIKHNTYGLLKLETDLTGADGAYLDLYHNSSSPADEDQLGSIGFKGKNSAGEETTYARIQSRSSDVTDGTEDGYLTFHTRAAGDFAEKLRIDSIGRVGINTDSFNDAREALRVQAPAGQTDTFLTIKATSTTGYSALFFGDNDFNEGRIQYQHNGDYLQFYTNDAERLRIDKVGSAIFSNGMMIESVNITAGKLSDNLQVDLDNGVVHHFTTTETTTATPNLVSSAGINTTMATGDNMVVTIITTTAAAAYSAALKIDGSSVTVKWVGGSAPSAGGSSGVDIYSYNIIKTGSGAYTVIGNLTNAA